MILHFRIALVLASLAFAYFFGVTLEKFILEVIRIFIPVDVSNAAYFNLAQVFAAVFPVFLLGAVLSLSYGADEKERADLWRGTWSVIFGITAFRLFQLWWILRGGVGEGLQTVTEEVALNHLFWMEKSVPFLVLGGVSSLAMAVQERAVYIKHAVYSSCFSYLWLFFTHQIPGIEGPKERFISLFFLLISAIFCAKGVKKIKEF